MNSYLLYLIENVGNKKKFQCNECEKRVTDMPRHMRTVHKWSAEKARHANMLFANRSYMWKNGAPKRKKKQQKKEKDKNSEEKDIEKPERKKKDYHFKRHCPYPGCHAVVKRLGKHLRTVHKLDDNEYKCFISSSRRFEKKSNKEVLEEQKACDRRDRFRRVMEEDNILVDFSDDNSSKAIYVPPEKDSYEILNIPSSAKPVAVDNCSRSKAGNFISNEQLFREFYQYLISVDGGRLSDAKTSPQYSKMIQTVVSVLDGDLSQLCNRKAMRTRFLGEYCAEKKYAPLTIKKYLMALQHFYTYLLDEEINIAGYASDDILRMKVFMFRFSLLLDFYLENFLSRTRIEDCID